MQIDEDPTVGIEAFSRIAPAVPIIANVIVSNYIFEFLTASTGGRLQYSTYEKYLSALEKYSNSFCNLLLYLHMRNILCSMFLDLECNKIDFSTGLLKT